MKNLKVKNNVTALLLLLTACSTTSNFNTENSYFLIKNESEHATEIIVTPDRVVLQCEELDEDPDEGRYGFMIHMLDEKNTVTTSSLNVRPDKKGCEKVYKDVARILKKAKRVYVASHLKLSDQPRVTIRKFSHNFPQHGTFYNNNRSLDFDIIANEKGECYNVHVEKNKPCLEHPFPIKNQDNELNSK